MRTILVFLIIFSIIVVIHEFGHYYMAKRAGIRVREFAIGMGPKLFATQDSEGTTYTIRMLPLGGYVRLAGLYEDEVIEPGMEVGIGLSGVAEGVGLNDFDGADGADGADRLGGVNEVNEVDKTAGENKVTLINLSDNFGEDELPLRIDDVDLIHEMYIQGIPAGQRDLVRYQVSKTAQVIEQDGTRLPVAPIETRYESASVWNKFKTNVAGPLMNFVLSIIVFTLFAFMIGGVPSTSNTIGDVQADSPAAQAGLQSGDTITSIDGESIDSWNDIVATTQTRPGETVDIEYVREGQDNPVQSQVTIASVTAQEGAEPIGQIGVSVGRADGFIDKITFGFTETWGVITGVIGVIAGMITNGFNINNFGGPVAMAQMTGEVVDSGLGVIIWFLGMLSANIGIFNLMPIPALDGGKILLNAIEGIRGKPLSQSTEGIITIIGVVLMLALVIAVTWNDIQRAFF